jgi:small subunit ribosomal protein S20
MRLRIRRSAAPPGTVPPSLSCFGGPTLAKTPRSWTGARTPSGLKRVRQAERRRDILQPRRTAAKTLVAKAIRVATQPTDGQDTQAALIEALSALDRAAKVGAIHPNAAARRKSRLTIKFNDALGGFAVQPTARAAKTTGKAQAAKAAKARIAASRADKAKGAQTAAGKARAALTKTSRTEAAKAEPTATAATAAKTSRAGTKAASGAAARGKATGAESKTKTTRTTAKKTPKS